MKSRLHELGAWAIALVLAVAAASKAIDPSSGSGATTRAGWIVLEVGLAACVAWRRVRDLAVVVVAGGIAGAALYRALGSQAQWTSCRCFGDAGISDSTALSLQAVVVTVAGLVLRTSPRRAG